MGLQHGSQASPVVGTPNGHTGAGQGQKPNCQRPSRHWRVQVQQPGVLHVAPSAPHTPPRAHGPPPPLPLAPPLPPLPLAPPLPTEPAVPPTPPRPPEPLDPPALLPPVPPRPPPACSDTYLPPHEAVTSARATAINVRRIASPVEHTCPGYRPRSKTSRTGTRSPRCRCLLRDSPDCSSNFPAPRLCTRRPHNARLCSRCRCGNS